MYQSQITEANAKSTGYTCTWYIASRENADKWSYYYLFNTVPTYRVWRENMFVRPLLERLLSNLCEPVGWIHSVEGRE